MNVISSSFPYSYNLFLQFVWFVIYCFLWFDLLYTVKLTFNPKEKNQYSENIAYICRGVYQALTSGTFTEYSNLLSSHQLGFMKMITDYNSFAIYMLFTVKQVFM